MSKDTNSDDVQTDSSQLIPPRVETTMRISRTLTTEHLVIVIPLLVALVFSAIFFLARVYWLAIGALLFALFFGTAGMFAVVTTAWHETPKFRLEMWLESSLRRGKLPLGSVTDVADEIDVSEISDDGVTVHDDGRQSTHVRMHGANTSRMAVAERDHLVAQLSGEIDETVKNIPVTYYATTFDFDPSEAVSSYLARADGDESIQTGEGALTKEMLLDISSWFNNDDHEAYDARDWRTYYEVAVDEGVATVDLWSWRDYFHPFRSAEQNGTQRRALVRSELEDRVSRVMGAIQSVDGISPERVRRDEEAAIHLNYWTGRKDVAALASRDEQLGDKDRDRDSQRDETQSNNHLLSLTASAPSVDASLSSLKRMLLPGDFEERDTHIQLGNTLVRVYWISDWPERPKSLFLRQLFTMSGIDATIKIHSRDVPKQRAIDDLDDIIPDIDAEGEERADSSDLGAADVAKDVIAWVDMREHLRTTNAQAWKTAGYIVVRADDQATIEQLDEAAHEYSNPDAARFDALVSACDTVRETAESSPADLSLLSAGRDHLPAFLSAAPGRRDSFSRRTGGRSFSDRLQRRPETNPRVRWMCGGALGAMFPPCSGVLRETGAGAFEWGRNLQNRSLIRADPFVRGESAHGGIVGKTRSGKSFDVQRMVARWYNGGNDRTLILCDTQGEFAGLTEFLGGEHIMLDGKSQSINPFAISSVPDWMLNSSERANVDPYGMKIESIVNLVSGIIKAQDADPSDYIPIIEEAAQRMYDEAGIYRGNLESHGNADPTGRDFLVQVRNILDDEGEDLWDHAQVQQTVDEWASTLLARLSTFKKGGRHSWLMGEDTTNILNDDIDMIYIDLSQLRVQRSVELSATLGLVFDQVSQKIRQADKSIAAFDEAHEFLHSDRSTTWLEAASREWARYDAGLWLISQSPREFIERATSGVENRRQNIVNQWSWMKIFHTPRIETDLLTNPPINMNQIQANDVSNGNLVPGKSGRGFSTCYTYFEDQTGWWHTRIEASPLEKLVYSYDQGEHGDFYDYLLERYDSPLLADAIAARKRSRSDTTATTQDTIEHGSAKLLTADIESVNGIGPTYADRLRAEGITTVDDILAQSPVEVASIADAPESKGHEWVGQSRLINRLVDGDSSRLKKGDTLSTEADD